MTDLLQRDTELHAEALASEPSLDVTVAPEQAPDAERPVIRFSEAIRPLLVAGLATIGSAQMTGGIFGSWTARGLGAGAAVAGVLWAFVAYRARVRVAFQVAVVPLAFLVGAVALVPTREGPTGVFSMMSHAVSTGHLLRPPVPFDAGWRPIITLVFMVLGFGAGWIALALRRPQLALLLPVPVLLLTAISQPAEGAFIGSIAGFMPVLLALGVLFGGDMQQAEGLGGQFELKRLIRSVPMALGGLALLVVLGQTDFLFPKPVYNPSNKPTKPKTIPPGQVRDRVLFSVEVPDGFTGPWRVGALDVYDGASWRLPPLDKNRFQRLPGDGVVDKLRLPELDVTFTTGDLGDTSVLPSAPDPVKISISEGGISYDPRTATLRMNNGRVPQGITYKESLPAYPKPDQLKGYGPVRNAPAELTEVPQPPADIQALLAQAPANPWERLDFLRKRLDDNVTAAGAGNPAQPVPPSKVRDLLFGSKEGSPYEIVAAEALLARWAGWPARVGFGFDKFNDEDGKKTIRPKNGATWLEIDVQGAGWVPVIGAPPKAKSSLDNDPNARPDPSILPSQDIAVELLIPVKVQNLRLLYERIRAFLLAALPFVLVLVALHLATPALLRARRRRKRLRWAHAHGPRAEVAVEYAELRDALYDLNVGDAHDTPLEYLQRCVPDDAHAELAWLVTRATYGDLAFALSEVDAEAAAELASSVRRRMFAAQPFQSRALAWLSRESLRRPYTHEVPSVRVPSLKRRRAADGATRSGRGAPRRRGAGVLGKVRQLVPMGNR